MEIILLQDVARLGSKDDVITVKNGFRSQLFDSSKDGSYRHRISKESIG